MPLPLEGVRILDLTRALAGPFCTMILGDLGATVIKTEPTQGGDMSRSWGPYHDGIGVFYLSINRNKQSLAVNFREPRGLELLQQLARDADVVVENFKPGTTIRLLRTRHGLSTQVSQVLVPTVLMASGRVMIRLPKACQA